MTIARRTTAKAFAKNVFINQERKLEDRRRLDTVLVLTVNYADRGFANAILLGEHPPGNQSDWVPGGVWLQNRNLKELTEGHTRSGACGSI